MKILLDDTIERGKKKYMGFQRKKRREKLNLMSGVSEVVTIRGRKEK